MKKIVMIYLLSCITLLFNNVNIYAKSYAKSSTKPTEQVLDHIVAVVNDDIIAKSDLSRALIRVKAQINQENLPIPPQAILEQQVLDQLINKTLQLQLAKSVGIQMSDDELNTIISRIAEQNQVTVKELYRRINQEGLSTTEYRQEIQEQVTVQKLQQQEVAGKLTISPEEITTFLHSRAWLANTGKEYHLEDILIPLPDSPTSEQVAKAKERAELILVKLEHGKNFRKMAQIESGNSHAFKGGDLGWRKLPEIPSAFTEQVTHMQSKEISSPIQTPNGFHIIRLVDIRTIPTHDSPPDRKQIENLLLQQKLEEAVQNWVSRLRAQAFITTTSRQA
jgi:peptidyl-prolyl cis-trans isomerase SurA